MELRRILSPSAAQLAPLQQKFHEYARDRIPDLPPESADKPFLIGAYRQGRFIGGINGKVYWSGLEIDTLWVDQDFRNRGYGRDLLQAAEAYARDNGAVVAFLKTVEAAGFYQGQGYEIYGTLEDRPPGTLLYHMKKRLDR